MIFSTKRSFRECEYPPRRDVRHSFKLPRRFPASTGDLRLHQELFTQDAGKGAAGGGPFHAQRGRMFLHRAHFIADPWRIGRWEAWEPTNIRMEYYHRIMSYIYIYHHNGICYYHNYGIKLNCGILPWLGILIGDSGQKRVSQLVQFTPIAIVFIVVNYWGWSPHRIQKKWLRT